MRLEFCMRDSQKIALLLLLLLLFLLLSP
jgi:hypothetical protein